MSTPIPNTAEFIKTGMDTARHFGFGLFDEIKGGLEKNTNKKTPPVKIPSQERKIDSLGGVLTSGASLYFEHHAIETGHPVLFSTIEQMPRSEDISIGLHILGVGKSIAEALLIETTRSLLRDLGYTSHTVRINSLGDRESTNRYTRELSNFFRKRVEDLPPQARELLKQHAFSALAHLIEKEHELSFRTPSPLEYLSDGSRKHFREIVEYLDMAGARYEIDTRLMGHHQCYSDALFSIDIENELGQKIPDTPITVRGGRYDEFVKRLTKTNMPATGAVITLKTKKAPARLPKTTGKNTPSVFVVQIGFGPKIKSLLLLEDLKRAHIPAYQALSSDSLSEQLQLAETYQVPYSLIVGQKEFVEGSIIVRDMRSRSQESVMLSALIPHLRKVVR